MKKVKVKHTRRLFSEICDRLGVNAELLITEDCHRYGNQAKEVINRVAAAYGFSFNDSQANFIFINTKLIHKAFREKQADFMKMFSLGVGYIPKSMNVVLAIIMIHECTHSQLYVESTKNNQKVKIIDDKSEEHQETKINIINESQDISTGMDQLISKLIRYDMISSFFNDEWNEELLKDMHDDAFYKAFGENLIECCDIIDRLQARSR